LTPHNDLYVFQFQYGAIRSGTLSAGYVLDAQFQFQYGAIRRNLSVGTAYTMTKFQFQYGAIRRPHIFSFPQATILISIPVWCD